MRQKTRRMTASQNLVFSDPRIKPLSRLMVAILSSAGTALRTAEPSKAG
jgi:hypothetical protein